MPTSHSVPSGGEELGTGARGGAEWLRAVFEGSSVGICVVDVEGRFLEVNPAFARLVGRSAEELRGTPSSSFDPQEGGGSGSSILSEIAQGEPARHQRETRYVLGDGTSVPVRLTSWVIRDQADRPRFRVAMVEDIREQKALEERLLHDARHDPLTGLPNRAQLMECLEAEVERASREDGYRFALLFVELARFKMVTDSLGHQVGDEMLRAVAARLRDRVRPGDMAARLSGDEFAILARDLKGADHAIAIADEVIASFEAPIDLGEYETFTTPTLGIALSGPEIGGPVDLLRSADMAMYAARASGYARRTVFDQSMHAAATDRLQFENDLRHALTRSEFTVLYQPIVSLATGRTTSLEAVLRWSRGRSGFVSPERFIRQAEDTGVIFALGRWVLGEAIRQLADWRRRIPGAESLEVSVNVSVKQLLDIGLAPTIRELLGESGLPPQNLKLELTESIMLDESAISGGAIAQLTELGVQLYLDDFGTGYSSLSHLHRLPLDALKIDQSFVRRMGEGGPEGQEGEEIVHTIIRLARSLGVRVVAEGVETAGQLATLHGLGCDFGQGYLFSPPVPAGRVEELLRTTPLGPLPKS